MRLLLITSIILPLISASHVFLHRHRTIQSRAPAWGLLARSQQHVKSAISNHLTPLRLVQLRGGADTGYSHESTKDEIPSPAPNITPTLLEPSNKNDLSSNEMDGKENRALDDNEMQYATIGILNISTTHGDNTIFLSFNYKDDQDHQINEKWGVRETAPIESIILPNGYHDVNDLVLAEVYGCLCHGIVINLPEMMMFGSPDNDSRHLDDMLLCVARGILRRLKGRQQITIPLFIVLDRVEADCQDPDAAIATTNYIQTYLERALCQLWVQLVGMPGDSILEQCNVVVSFSSSSASEKKTAGELAKRILDQDSAYDNIVPRSLFITLCKQMYKEIHKGWLPLSDSLKEVPTTEWKMLYLDDSTTTLAKNSGADENLELDVATESKKSEAHPSSSDFRQKVQSVMALAFADAEEDLQDMENKMDEAFLDSSGESNPMPDFVSDADALLSVVSEFFRPFLDENELISESDREWANG